MRQGFLGFLWLAAGLLATLPALADESTAAEKAVIEVIDRAYVQGLWQNRDLDAMRSGFDPSFVMQNLSEGVVKSTRLDEWIEWIGTPTGPNPKKVRGEIEVLDIEGEVAAARVKISEDGKLRFTDYFALYHTEDGWKIVAKTYQGHG